MARKQSPAPLALMLAVVCAAGIGLIASPPHAGTQRAPSRPEQVAASGPASRPNIIVISTDDQNRDELRWMPHTRHLLADHGVTFTHALSPDPLCCPARAELLTGQLGQNNGIRYNSGSAGGFHSLQQKGNTIARWLSAVGYQTAMVGKYLNGYSRSEGRQPGWTVWRPLVAGVYTYVDSKFYNIPGRLHTNVSRAITDLTVEDIYRFAAGDEPFFLWSSHLAPHERAEGGTRRPPLPTRGHRDDLEHVGAPSLSKPSFNRVPEGQRPYEPERPRSSREIQCWFTRRIQSLLDVDDAVARVVSALADTGRLANTYIFLVSDHAMLLGEHRIRGKNTLYREDLEIPLVVRVPGADARTSSSLPVTPTDLAPTIAALADAPVERHEDGVSFAPVLGGGRVPWRDTQLIQTGGLTTRWTYQGVRTRRYTYFRRTADGADFLFDHRVDPYELHDVSGVSRYRRTVRELRDRTAALRRCAGATCNPVFGPVPAPVR